MKEVVPGLPDLLDPERHHLHETACARAGYGVFAKGAFHLYQAQHHLRIEPGAFGFVVHRNQKFFARVPVGEAPFEFLRHGVEPCARFLQGVEREKGRRLVADRRLHLALYARSQRFIFLIAGVRQRNAGSQRQRNQPPHTSFLMVSAALSTAIGCAALSRRPWYSN